MPASSPLTAAQQDVFAGRAGASEVQPAICPGCLGDAGRLSARHAKDTTFGPSKAYVQACILVQVRYPAG